jgi:peptidoglycan-associated lipoprotein
MQASIRYLFFAFLASALVLAVGCRRAAKVAATEPGYSVHVEKAPPGYQPPGGVGEVSEIELAKRPGPGVELSTPISQTEDASQYGVVDRIHFDYDKSDIKPEFVRGLENNARWMRDHKDYQMLIEGHCDERGTNEYNMALGERRAMAARNFLIQQGVQPDRLHIKSWGEEKPVAFGHDESSWWQNRRAEFLVGRGNP